MFTKNLKEVAYPRSRQINLQQSQNMKTLHSLVGFMLLCLSGCSTTSNVKYEISEDFDSNGYSTFAILPIPLHEEGTPSWILLGEGDTSLVILKSALEAKGFEKVAYADADCLIGVRIISKKITSKEHDYNRPDGSSKTSSDMILSEASTGRDRIASTGGNLPTQPSVPQADYYRWTIRVEVFDKDSKLRVWTGLTQAKGSTSTMRRSDILNTINEILKPFSR